MTTDRDLQQRVLNALDFESGVDASRIAITAHEGIVTISGLVQTLAERSQAERAVARIRDVRGLANDLEVKVDGAARRDDAAIAEAAANTIAWDSAVPPQRVKVAVHDGWITLSGQVEWRFQREAAEQPLHRLFGVRGITNLISVAPRARSAKVRRMIEEALERHAHVDAQRLHVDAHAGSVILSGIVHSLAERREAERAAWSAPGVSAVNNLIAVDPR